MFCPVCGNKIPENYKFCYKCGSATPVDTDNGTSSPISGCTCCHHKARRTLELSAELSVSRDCWRKLISQVCGVIFCDFRHACHRRRIFNMLNNFMHEWTFPHSVRALWAISAVIDANARFYHILDSRWRMLMKIMIRARQKIKKFCFTYCYYDEDEDAWSS